jgi:V-type H+-transporting ATPase subunit D
MQAASFSYAEVAYVAGDIGYQIRENVKKAQFKVKTRYALLCFINLSVRQENVSGVMLPAFEKWIEGGNSNELTGLSKG